MEHLKIWIQIVALIAGTGVLFDTFRYIRKYDFPFLRPMWWCYLFLNLGFLTGVISEYVHINLFDNALLFKTSMFGEIIDPFSSMFFVGLVYFLISLNLSFRDRSPTKGIQWLFLVGIVLIVARAGLILLVNQTSTVIGIFNAVNIGVLTFLFALAVWILGRLAIRGGEAGSGLGAGAVRVLGLFYLSGCALTLTSAAFAGSSHGFVRAFISLAFNIFPFIWYRRYLPAFGGSPVDIGNAADLDTFCQRHGVSDRQREIIELILHGKNNREIAETLYIAPHTVKNHVYNLYQKLCIKSRFELVSMFLKDGSK
ncbi:MAG: hypothetical protein JSU65_11285 [Candidatus Zixiibacteriota bacterium]|nr:MAG: hypothetical protein JSU65_11285 [candidate division Zixibacteria bacterium]